MIVCASAWLKKWCVCGVVVVLAACQTPAASNNTSLNTPPLPHAAQVQRSQTQTIGYFDAAGRFSTSQQASSAYVRQQLGWDAHGHPVLQDFYVWQHRPQTSAYAVINPDALHTWNIDDAGEGEFAAALVGTGIRVTELRADAAPLETTFLSIAASDVAEAA